MALVHINSEHLNSNDPNTVFPSYINNNLTTLNPYQNFVYGINPLSVVYKYCYFKEFGFNFCVLTLNESFNTNLTYFNITTGIKTVYFFQPQNFNTMADFITYLNTTCTDLNFVYNDPSTPQINLQKNGRITINNIAGDSFRLIFDSKSIFRLLGFYFGTTQDVPAGLGNEINGVYNATLEPIGTMYLSISLPSTNLSNLFSSFNFILVIPRQPTEFGEKIRIFENTTFSQRFRLFSTQFNQIKITINDAYGNYVPLNSIYTLTLAFDD